MMRSLQAGAIFLIMISSYSGWAAPANLKPPVLETLPNGLQIAWFLDEKLPLLDIALYVWSGTSDDLENKSGTAQLLASTLFRGAAGLSAPEIARITERLGASRHSEAEEEYLAVGLHGISDDAPALLALLSKVALQPDFAVTEVEEQKARSMDRWRHVVDYGSTLAGIAFDRRVTAGTRYGRGSFVSMGEFQKLSSADLKLFHRKFFQPRNAILLVSGRANQEKLRGLILREFGRDLGTWKADAPLPSEGKIYVEPRIGRMKERLLLVDRPELAQASVQLGFPAPLLPSPDHYPLLVLNALTGEYFNSRLNALLRDHLGLTYSIGSSFSFEPELTLFSIGASTRNQTAAKLIGKTLEVLADIHAGNISETEVATAKEFLIGSFSIAAAAPGGSISRWLIGKLFGMGPEYLNEHFEKIRAVTRDQVIAAAKKHLNPNAAVIAVAGNAKQIDRDLRPLKIAPSRTISVEEIL